MSSFFTSNFWIGYLLFFALFAKSLWFVYYYALYGISSKKPGPLYKGKTALIVPAYNEEIDKLTDTVEHAVKAKGIDEMVFINDGSDKTDVGGALRALQKKHNFRFKVVDLKQNVGKRSAQHAGLQVISDDVETIVFMDSDTILQKNSVQELTRQMNDPKIGGITACILVKNKNDNLLTKATAAMYWSASHIWRQAPGNMGFIQVTNGQLSCYRASVIRDLMPRYLTQDFMGVRCTLSDDRYITHHMQTEYGLQVAYEPRAEVYTYVPNTFKGTYKMFLRWKRGAWRESLLVLSQAKKKPLLVADIWANHAVQVMQTIVRLAVLMIGIFINPMVIVYYFGVVLIISLLFGYHMIWYNIKELPYRLVYSVMNEAFFAWTHVHALLTIQHQGKWATR